MATLSLPGLSTGIDTSLIIRQLVAAASVNGQRLQAKRQTFQEKNTAFTNLETRLGSLKDTVDELRSSAELRAYAVTTGDETKMTAEATSSASEGNHEIVIDRLAAADRKVHAAGLAELTTLVGAGTFVYTYDGKERTIQTTATTTLEGLRDLINNDGANPGVNASLLEYGPGGTTAYHLVLGGADTGADHAIVIDDDKTSLDAFDSDAFTTTQAAQNARIRVDGYPADPDWIERGSNTVDDVLPGVTLYLKATSSTAVSLSLTRDTEGLKTKIKDFVSAYNSVVDYAKQQTAYNAETRAAGTLMGEYTIASVLYRLRTPLIEQATGFQDAQDAYTLAAQIGLTVKSDGKLELTEETVESESKLRQGLDDAISDNYLGVLALLGASNTGDTDSTNLRFYGAHNTTTPGNYEVKATFTDGTLTAAWFRTAGEPDSAWRAATVDGNLIVGAEGNPEQNLQITGSYTGSGTTTANVRVRQGIAGRLYDTIENDLSDIIDLSQSRLSTLIKTVDRDITREEERVTRYQTRLTAQYAKLEQTLTLLKAQQAAVTYSGL